MFAEIRKGSLSRLSVSLLDFTLVASPRSLVLQREPVPRLHVFPHMTRLIHVSYAWHWLHVFPDMLTIHVFLCLAVVTCFPTLDSPYMFSYA